MNRNSSSKMSRHGRLVLLAFGPVILALVGLSATADILASRLGGMLGGLVLVAGFWAVLAGCVVMGDQIRAVLAHDRQNPG